MKLILRHRPSPAMVVAVLALIVALGGTAIATIQPSPLRGTAAQKKRHADRKADVRLIKKLTPKLVAKLAPTLSVSKAQSAITANRAVTANRAATATNAGFAATAGGAPPTGPAGGALSGNYPDPGFAPLEPPKRPTLENGWSDAGLGSNPVTFQKGPFGGARLSGGVTGGSQFAPMFHLPVGYRPSGLNLVSVLASTGPGGTGTLVPAFLQIRPDGEVSLLAGGSTGFVGLDSVRFGSS